jgi:hypothetical protein
MIEKSARVMRKTSSEHARKLQAVYQNTEIPNNPVINRKYSDAKSTLVPEATARASRSPSLDSFDEPILQKTSITMQKLRRQSADLPLEQTDRIAEQNGTERMHP